MFSQQRASKWMCIGVDVLCVCVEQRGQFASSASPQHRVNCALVSQRAGFLSLVAVVQR